MRPQKIPLSDIAQLTGAEIAGRADVIIERLARIYESETGDLTFLYLPAYEKHFPETKASAIFVRKDFSRTREDITYLLVKDPNVAFFQTLIHFFSPDFFLEGIASSAVIAHSAQLGDNVAIGENVVIGEHCGIGANSKIFPNTTVSHHVTIGKDCLIFPNVSIREESVVGNRVIIHSGAVIGSDGFGYYQDAQKAYHKIPQIGNVVLEDDVEIGANTTIDRAALGSTIIHKGTKLDNLVQIAHGVEVGENTAISAQTGIAGSTKIGNRVITGGQVGIVGHIEIGDDVTLASQAGISKSLPKPGIYSSYPAKEHKTALRLEAHIRNLPDYSARIAALEKRIAELEKEKTNSSE